MLILTRTKDKTVEFSFSEEVLRTLLTEAQQTNKPVEISILVTTLNSNMVKLGITAPRCVPIRRGELPVTAPERSQQ